MPNPIKVLDELPLGRLALKEGQSVKMLVYMIEASEVSESIIDNRKLGLEVYASGEGIKRIGRLISTDENILVETKSLVIEPGDWLFVVTPGNRCYEVHVDSVG
jgi:hypothetical protein